MVFLPVLPPLCTCVLLLAARISGGIIGSPCRSSHAGEEGCTVAQLVIPEPVSRSLSLSLSRSITDGELISRNDTDMERLLLDPNFDLPPTLPPPPTLALILALVLCPPPVVVLERRDSLLDLKLEKPGLCVPVPTAESESETD